MDILTIPFEEHFIVDLGYATVEIVAFKTKEHGNIKIGIEAEFHIPVHREEIHRAIKAKEKLVEA